MLHIHAAWRSHTHLLLSEARVLSHAHTQLIIEQLFAMLGAEVLAAGRVDWPCVLK
jgi:hypothetical protein